MFSISADQEIIEKIRGLCREGVIARLQFDASIFDNRAEGGRDGVRHGHLGSWGLSGIICCKEREGSPNPMENELFQ